MTRLILNKVHYPTFEMVVMVSQSLKF